ncbi:MAG: DinB family protein [Terriglobia bacterium]
MDIKEFFLKQKEAIHKGDLSVFGKIPPDRLDWKPADGLLTLGELARHVWTSEDGLRRIALGGDWSYFEARIPHGLHAVLGETRSLSEELEHIEKTHRETLREAGEFPLERWDEERVHEGLKMRRRISVLLFAINEHHIHHRAQAGVYLRILTGERASPYEL